MIRAAQDELLLRCSCSSLDHLVCFTRFVEDDNPRKTYVNVILDQRRSFFRRFITAFRYVLGLDVCRYGTLAEVVLEPEEEARLHAWLAQ